MQKLKLFIVFYKTNTSDSVTVIDSFNCRSLASEFAATVVDVPNPQVLYKSIFKSKYPDAYEKYYPIGAVIGWQFCKDILPEEKHPKKGYLENGDLLLIKWDKHDSLELAVLTRINGALIWEIPDHGYAEMSEVSQWMRIPACR